MSTFLKIILSSSIAVVVLIAGIYVGEKTTTPQATPLSFGSSFTPVQGTQYTLAGAGVNATQNTLQLTSFTTPDGRLLTMSMFGNIGYGTIEPNTSSKIEDVTFTGISQNANGSAVLTGVTRGNDFIAPFAASTTLAKAHAGGSYFILSNTAGFYGQQFLFANNAGTSTATIVFSSTTPPYLDSPAAQASGSPIATTSEFATIAYVNSTVLVGAANATAAVKGILQLATAAQAAAGTLLGSTGASLALSSGISTSTPGVQAINVIPVTGTNEKLAQAFLDLTQAFTWTGQQTWNNAQNVFTGTNAKVGIGTSTPYTALAVVGNTGVLADLFTATSTIATSSFAGNLQVLKNATTTNLTVSNSCSHCVQPTIVNAANASCGGGAGTACSESVSCNGSQIVVGGGANTSAAEKITASYPSNTTTWQANSVTTSSDSTYTLTAYAICVNP